MQSSEKDPQVRDAGYGYEIRAYEHRDLDQAQNTWSSQRVEIWKNDSKVGEYIYNYMSDFPFHVFVLRGKEYALYSKRYMYTRVMSLPDCKDLGGEDDSNVEYKDHFCPVEYYVPSHNEKKRKLMCENPEFFITTPGCRLDGSFGFVAGCAWGDDSSQKIQFLDLSRADEGILRRTDRFGYLELPSGMSLKKAVTLGDDDMGCNDCLQFDIYARHTFRLTGELTGNSFLSDEYTRQLYALEKQGIKDGPVVEWLRKKHEEMWPEGQA